MSQIQIELHCHTIYSKDSLVEPRRLLQECWEKNIQRVAITDHNTIRGALEARNLDPDRVIVGEEIMTTQGELLAYFVKEEVPARLEPEDVISRLRDQGAYISVSHPFDFVRNGSWRLKDLVRIAPLVDAVETFNARCYLDRSNLEAAEFAKTWNLAGTGGADAHSIRELGQAKMFIEEYSDQIGFRHSIQNASILGVRSPGWVHFISRWAVWMKQAGLIRM